MDVTKSNFNDLLPQIRTAIEKSDFISIDCELTGLNTGLTVNAYDTQRQYYEKVRKGSKNFLVIQYGVCIFRYDKTEKIFKQQAYNFYVFTRPVNKRVPDHRFLCQASSMEFLIKQGFDFNKLFKEGISYLNTEEEDQYKKSLLEYQQLRVKQRLNSFSPQTEQYNNLPMTVEEKSFVDDVFKQIEEFIASDKDKMDLPKCNAYVRRLIYNEAHKRTHKRASLETRQLENRDRVLVVTRPKSKAAWEEEDRKSIEMEEQEMKNCIGFSKVIKSIVASGKLVVGHNMCLDLFHTIDKFLTPLPDDYEEFKELANYSFPNLLDTKHMSSAGPFKELIHSNVLAHLVQAMKEKPFEIPTVEIDEGGAGYKLDTEKEHEAGFDAYITGLCFLTMWKHLGSLKASNTLDPFANFSLIEPYKNRLFLMRLQDAPYMRLGGKDPTPSRENVLYLKFPKEWKLSDINQLFSPFGNVHVAWIDECSCYVGLQKQGQTAVALSTLSQSDTYTVISYAKRQAQLTGQNFLAVSPQPSFRSRKSSDGFTTVTKKRRTASFGETSAAKRKRSIDPIDEVPEELPQKLSDEDVGVPIQRSEIPKLGNVETTGLKTFAENDDWD